MRHLFCHLNVKTKRPNELKGQIGQKLESCPNLPTVVFLLIENNPPHLENKKDLSTDKKYLMDMCITVSSRYCSLDLFSKDPDYIDLKKNYKLPASLPCLETHLSKKENPSS